MSGGSTRDIYLEGMKIPKLSNPLRALRRQIRGRPPLCTSSLGHTYSWGFCLPFLSWEACSSHSHSLITTLKQTHSDFLPPVSLFKQETNTFDFISLKSEDRLRTQPEYEAITNLQTSKHSFTSFFL